MTEINPQDETGTTEVPHSPPDEHRGPNPSEEHLSLDDSEGCLNTDLLGSSDRAEEHPIPDRPEEHPRRDLSEEHPEPNLSKSIEELLRDFENYQKQQLQILQAIAHKATNTFQHATAQPVLHRNARQTIEVLHETWERIQQWNNRQSSHSELSEVFETLVLASDNDSKMKELITTIRMCMAKLPDTEGVTLMYLYTALYEHSPNLNTSSGDAFKIIQYRLENSGWATPQNDRDLICDSTENGPVCAQKIQYFMEYRSLSMDQICRIVHLFVSFTTQLRDQSELSSHVMKFVLGYAVEWKFLKCSNACTDDVSTFQFNLRFFEIPLEDHNPDIERIKKQPGRLTETGLCREIGYIPRPRRTGSMISERRASVVMAYGRQMHTPYWTIFDFSGQNSPRPDEKGTEEKRQYFLDGISHFREWYSLLDMELHNCLLAWQKVLSEMDVGIGLKIDELCNPQSLGDLMRDGSYSKRSEFYFVSFSMLRKFSDCMEETLEDLEHCYQEVNDRLKEDGTSAEGKEAIQNISRQVLERHRKNFKDLLHQIQKKINMIMPLQESLFNSTSIREASEATHQGRYIFVFTIMTIVYLPLGFVTSLFGMNNITENSPLTTSMAPFAVTFSVIAAVTYIIASGSFPFANRTKFHPLLGLKWNELRLFFDKEEKKKKMMRKRTGLDLLTRHQWDDLIPRYHQNPPSPSPKSGALKRFFSILQPRRSQPTEANRDIENGSNPTAAASATAQTREDATLQTI